MRPKRYRLPMMVETPIPSRLEAMLPQPVRWYIEADDYDSLLEVAQIALDEMRRTPLPPHSFKEAIKLLSETIGRGQ